MGDKYGGVTAKQASESMRRTMDVIFNMKNKSKDKLILLVGASGSGKTTIAKELEKEGYNIIHSYTTREQREPNEWGHIFAKYPSTMHRPDGMIENICFESDNTEDEPSGKSGEENIYCHSNSQMIAFQEVYEGLHYWATKEQYQGKGTSIYVVDPKGAEQVKENVKDAEVITIFLMADRITRHNRIYGRQNTEGVGERLVKDEEIFKTSKCDYVVDANRGIEEVLKDVVDIIE